MIKVSPSILAADFVNLKRDIDKVNNADMLHVDVMDGVFVPNISIGIPVVESIRKSTNAYIDLHLMIIDPLKYVEDFCKAGADLVCFHIESESDTEETIKRIKSFGKKVALAIKPNTKAEEVKPFIKDLDMVLVMTVEPGFGGQSFMPDMLPKIEKIRAYANEINKDLDIQVDGGINKTNAKLVVEAGANVLVAGSFVFGSENPEKEVEFLKKL